MKLIPAILKINSQLIYGFNNRKNPYYKAYPLDSTLPEYLVALNDLKLLKETSMIKKNIYILVKEEKAPKNKKGKYGSIKKVLGDISDKNAHIEALIHKYGINTRKQKLSTVTKKTTIYDVFSEEDLKDYVKYQDEYTIAVDPKGCVDIDDALSLKSSGKGYKVGVHIADVSAYLEKFDLYHYLKHNNFSVYTPKNKYSLFPEILSDFLFSLHHNRDRLALTLFIYFDEDLNVERYEFRDTVVKLTKTMSYDKANSLIRTKQDKQLLKLFEISKKLGKVEEGFDSHNMIENFMLYANKMAAEYLIGQKKEVILRSHQGSKNLFDFTKINEAVQDKDVVEFLKIYEMNKASYVKYSGEETSYYHTGLNLHHYTHFTSPIRRSIDIYTHALIKSLSCQDFLDVEKVNEEEVRNKKLYNSIRKVENIDKIENGKTYEATLIDFEENSMTFYIKELKFIYRTKIFNKKVLDLHTIELRDDEIVVDDVVHKMYSSVDINLYTRDGCISWETQSF